MDLIFRLHFGQNTPSFFNFLFLKYRRRNSLISFLESKIHRPTRSQSNPPAKKNHPLVYPQLENQFVGDLPF